jgi:16S rRNA (uracil1498-N3)-methyltransferase
MARRIHVHTVSVGQLTLPSDQSHHLRDVLRLREGDEIEIFDNNGNVAEARIDKVDSQSVTVTASPPTAPAPPQLNLTIASALPKASRADWMIEKLSELGVTRFLPLMTSRSVVHPEGQQKYTRWTRIATESAKQSHRPGVLHIQALIPVRDFVPQITAPAAFLSPDASINLLQMTTDNGPLTNLTLLIGPEGGWTPEELNLFATANVRGVRLTQTILRVETAAITAAAVALCASNHHRAT